MNSFKKERQTIDRFEKIHHFSTKFLAIDALVTTLITVGIISLTANGQSSAITTQLINVGAIELTSPQLIHRILSNTSSGHVYWLGAKTDYLYTLDNSMWGTDWIEYHPVQAVTSNSALGGVRISTYDNSDFFAAHLAPLQASLLTTTITPIGRHAAYDLAEMDEVVVHIPGERAVIDVSFAGRQTLQTLVTTADSLVYF